MKDKAQSNQGDLSVLILMPVFKVNLIKLAAPIFLKKIGFSDLICHSIYCKEGIMYCSQKRVINKNFLT